MYTQINEYNTVQKETAEITKAFGAERKPTGVSL